MGYSYPIDPSWTRDELLSVMALFQIVEKAYEKGGCARRGLLQRIVTFLLLVFLKLN